MKLSAQDLKDYRSYTGISQKQLAQKLGCSQPFVTYMENGHRDISDNLADRLNLSFEIMQQIRERLAEREALLASD